MNKAGNTLSKVLLSAILCMILSLSAAPPIKDEYYKKARLIQLFPRYIQWPENATLNDTSTPFVIGVVGKNPFGKILENAFVVEEYKIKDKKVEIRYVTKLPEIEDCNILFITKSAVEFLPGILSITRNKPILTIGETEGFAQQGVQFNFYISKGEIRFEINATAILEANLVVDSELLSLARIINPPGDKK